MKKAIELDSTDAEPYYLLSFAYGEEGRFDDAKKAAKEIANKGVEAVVVKGGHLFSEKKAIDLLYYQDKFH